MTIPSAKPAFIACMRPIALITALTLASAAAQTPQPPLRDLLRDGLYAEEINRDTEAAARSYEQVVSRFDEDRPFAANALFRLAEIRRKQNRSEEAAKLYQRLVAAFPDADPQARLAREALAALGAKAPEIASDSSMNDNSPESIELRELEPLAASSPDLLDIRKRIHNSAINGWPRVVKYLLDHTGNDQKKEILNIALGGAATGGQLALCESLLAQGADPNAGGEGAILIQAVNKGYTNIVKLLLANKADINAHPADCYDPRSIQGQARAGMVGGPLHEAVYQGNTDMVKLLLDAGADPSLAMPPHAFTPLHLVFFGPNKVGKFDSLVNLLLDKGAKADVHTVAREASTSSSGSVVSPYTPSVSPLQLAVGSELGDVVKRLLAAGADAKDPGLLVNAIRSKQLDLVRLLLEKGADPNAWDKNVTPLQAAAADNHLTLVDLLLKHGAKIAPDWQGTDFANVLLGNNTVGPTPLPIRSALLKRFSFPGWSQEKRIRLIYADGTVTIPLSESDGDLMLPLSALLLNQKDELRVIKGSSTATLHRRKDDGGFTSSAIDLTSDEAYPDLQWGDILEMKSREDSNSPLWSAWTPEIEWALRRHTVVPVTLDLRGRQETLTLRGDCLTYDPTKPVAPWLSAGQLVRQLSHWDQRATLVVHRKEWPEAVKLRVDTPEANNFTLRAGDKIEVEPYQIGPETRRRSVFLQTPDLWHYKTLFTIENGFSSNPPTLLQAILGCYADNTLLAGQSPDSDLPQILQKVKVSLLVSDLLPHPDLSRIRIHRLGEDGKETTIEVDLEKAIAACKPSTTPEEARKSDLELQLGDIIELPIRKDAAGKRWEGFTEAESRFFTKALSFRLELVINDVLSFRDIVYAPARHLRTEGGTLMLAPATGSAQTSASSLQWSGGITSMHLIRNDRTAQVRYLGSLYFRPGDRLEINGTSSDYPRSSAAPNGNPVPAPSGNRPPRQRVIPPPAPSR